MIAAELPEGIALADPAAAVDALGDRERDLLGGHLQGRQRRGQMLGALPQGGGGDHQASGAHRRSMTSSSVTPSARAAKLSAMRWRSTGWARARTSSMEGAK